MVLKSPHTHTSGQLIFDVPSVLLGNLSLGASPLGCFSQGEEAEEVLAKHTSMCSFIIERKPVRRRGVGYFSLISKSQHFGTVTAHWKLQPVMGES